MNDFLPTEATWGNLLTVAIVLLLLFFLLQFLKRALRLATFMGNLQAIAQRWVNYFLLVYEMFAVLAVLGVFILINPFYHGSLVALLFVVSYAHMKNYFSGRVLRLKNQIKTGVNLKTGSQKGLIHSLDRIGLQLQTNEGLHYLPYGKLLSDGYTLMAGEQIGGYYQLRISPKKDNTINNHETHLFDLLVTTPYLEWHYKPEISKNEDLADDYTAKILVREEAHLHDLIQLVKEWGYNCKL